MIGALDIGGTHVAGARVDLRSASVDPESRSRIHFEPDGVRGELLGSILRAAATASNGGITGLGVAVPGPFDYERGISTIRHKLESLYGVDLRRALAAALELADAGSVRFVNDADAFGLGEWWAGAARGHRRAVGVTLGTGLGSAFLEDGRIVDARPDVPPEGALHLVPFRGAPVEDVVSRRGLLARYGASRADPVLDVEHVAERARRGESRAGKAFREVASALAESLMPWLVAFGPTCLVVGGSIARAWDLLGPVLKEELVGAKLELVTRASNLDDAPLLGAALHASRT